MIDHGESHAHLCCSYSDVCIGGEHIILDAREGGQVSSDEEDSDEESKSDNNPEIDSKRTSKDEAENTKSSKW